LSRVSPTANSSRTRENEEVPWPSVFRIYMAATRCMSYLESVQRKSDCMRSHMPGFAGIFQRADRWLDCSIRTAAVQSHPET
jgi:hypothetical protein